jgi:hypothetical protein
MKYEQIRDLSKEQFRRLTGIKTGTLTKMVAILREADREKKKQGERNNKLCIEDQLLQKEEIWTKIQSYCRKL